MLQNKNRMVKPLINALMLYNPRIALLGFEKGIINNLPNNMNNGAPGGCGIWSLYALEANSPQSQKLPVASIVIKYIIHATMQIAHPVISVSYTHLTLPTIYSV